MKRILLAAAIAAIASTTLAGEVRAEDDHHAHGTMCQPMYGQQGQVGYGEPGAGNFSNSSELGLFCPVPHSQNRFGVTGGRVSVYDNSSTTPFSCYMFAESWFGGTWWSSTKFTCSDPNGCADSTSVYTGHGYLQWINPFGNSDALGGFPTLGFRCSVPRSSTYASWVEAMLAWTIDR